MAPRASKFLSTLAVQAAEHGVTDPNGGPPLKGEQAIALLLGRRRRYVSVAVHGGVAGALRGRALRARRAEAARAEVSLDPADMDLVSAVSLPDPLFA